MKRIVANIFDVDLPANYFDCIFVSNFLEHLLFQHEVADFLVKMQKSLRSNGFIAIIGPNFKYCAAEYFDCADHFSTNLT